MEEATKNPIPAVEAPATVAAPIDAKIDAKGGRRGSQRDFKKNTRRGGPRSGKPRSEFDQKLISIRRVARVVAGGRRFTFSVAILIGDKKGSVGIGTGKAADTALAIEKALRSAKQSMVKFALTKTMSIPYEVEAKYSSARVWIMPTALGKGLVAGSSVRAVLELAGIRDITAKVLSGSKNQVNNAHAAIEALSEFKA
ncbi:MAG: 30S ribosomal protein S5 [Patescibacteria group bacterium]